jgi:hypothetical protein
LGGALLRLLANTDHQFPPCNHPKQTTSVSLLMRRWGCWKWDQTYWRSWPIFDQVLVSGLARTKQKINEFWVFDLRHWRWHLSSTFSIQPITPSCCHHA